MKHSLKITLVIMALFLTAQVVGLLVIKNYIDVEQTKATGQITYKNLPYNIERPVVTPLGSVALILGIIIVGTALLFLLIRFKRKTLWRAWFYFSVLFALSIALSAFIPSQLAFAISLILATLKIFRPGIIIHNLTEVFIYGGIAAIFVPVLNLIAAFVLLAGISIYDAYAVWKSKHMVKLAKFQASSKVFAGLFIPYKLPKIGKKPAQAAGAKSQASFRSAKVKSAMLGGGDIAFPLMFAGVVMKSTGFYQALLIPLFAGLALFLLMVKGEENKFYPAMPFISVGCVVGYAVTLLI